VHFHVQGAGEGGPARRDAARGQLPQASSREQTPLSPSPLDIQAPDASLLARIAAGDERALGDLYDRYARMAYSLAIALVKDPADAEEVVADAFAQVWRSASSFDSGRGSAAAWLATIVRTRGLDLLRAQRRRAKVIERASNLTDDGESPILAPAPERAERGAEITEAQTLVRQSLAALPVPQRKVIELAYFGGLSQSEIAAQLGEPLGTVKTRMRAGMEKLRLALAPLLEEGA
jgi:RNA polymerase sigma-70 factor (ECF subfamily)